jgi:hypothetical protein
MPQRIEPDQSHWKDQGNDGDANRLIWWTPVTELLDERGLSKLRWRCRRGLLENDLFLERFFKRFSDT